ncbi:BRCA1-associated RING domain 1 [Pelobates cultripes]|uniref:BRCA1-associated RING domain 1 n=1 Tax=Pelobates cultripes TaxID=61616 RepID=A0AAD1WD13_PELCU|nr:BRCA1-associated RING domain 1 [Pelobates cultripes]
MRLCPMSFEGGGCSLHKACVEENIGCECPICHTPSWVRDVQINRQLENIIQLCGKLSKLLDVKEPDENKKELCEDTSFKLNAIQGDECKKKQIKMRFSARSGKISCVLERERNQQQVPSNSEHSPHLSSYDFVSSSPTTEPKKKKCAAKPRKMKKRKLEDINQEWGFGHHNQDSDTLKECNNSSKTVSFSTPPDFLQSPDVEQEVGFKCGTLKQNVLEDNDCELEETVLGQSKKQNPTESNCVDLDEVSFESPKRQPRITSGKCQQTVSPIVSGSKRSRKGKTNDLKNKETLQSITPAVGSSIALDTCDTTEPSKENDHSIGVAKMGQTDSLRVSTNKFTNLQNVQEENDSIKQTKITPGKCTAHQMSPNKFPNAKRNHRGETMLHLASIKGDLQEVGVLLKNGANPNVKDNAGWTPLHEACNHGHTKVVELLLKHYALVNTAGYQNDTPLHDASKNGHLAIVQLLLSHGASPDAVNIFGLRPVDYAETEEIKSAFLEKRTNKEPQVTHPCTVLSPRQHQEEPIVLVASGLTTAQRTDLSKLAAQLKAEICSEFNKAVTHVIVNDKPMLRTMKCMMGTMAGCWILTFSWVKASLTSQGREPENKYEVHGGPHRARLNREQLLPKLLDGCYFYFLGYFKEHRKEDMMELVKVAGGQILNRQPKPDSDVTQSINTVAYHAEVDSDQRFCTQYILYDKTSKYCPSTVRQGKVWFVQSDWLINCITSFQLLPVLK